MKVKFLDVILMGTHLYKSGEVGEFSNQTAEELIKKGLAVLYDGNESAENPAGPLPQASKGGKGGKGKNSTLPKDENGAGGNENNGSEDGSNNSTDETNNSDDKTKSDENAQTTNEDAKPE
ncbi:hypothetical protein [Acinetobacter calcoaceticus]|uniref:hypothetical protein n=1 Tax=Acinetobacter calcoaceticus TaxID=471 RepID=UPI0018DD48D5|nr:hypothetical protein [Acinetobacter calcoaceticus]